MIYNELYDVADRQRQRYADYHDFGYIRENATTVSYDVLNFMRMNSPGPRNCSFNMERQLQRRILGLAKGA